MKELKKLLWNWNHSLATTYIFSFNWDSLHRSLIQLIRVTRQATRVREGRELN